MASKRKGRRWRWRKKAPETGCVEGQPELGKKHHHRRQPGQLCAYLTLYSLMLAIASLLNPLVVKFQWQDNVATIVSGAVTADAATASSHTINSPMSSEFDGASFYKATEGSRVRMLCNGSHWHQDSVALVLWFKGAHSEPIYTVDARSPFQTASKSSQQHHHSHKLDSQSKNFDHMPHARHHISDAYRGRARFVSSAMPPYLDLTDLEPDDQAEYRCRLDYRSEPRENFLAILFVIVPPKSVHIVEVDGPQSSFGELPLPLGAIYGPLSEGSDVQLMCLANGGRPAPAIRWLSNQAPSSSNDAAPTLANQQLLDDSYLTLTDFLSLQESTRLEQQQKQPGSFHSSSANNLSSLYSSISHNTREQLQSADAAIAQSEWLNLHEFMYFSEIVRRPPLSLGSQASLPAALSNRRLPGSSLQLAPDLLTLPMDELSNVISSINVLSLPRLHVQMFAPSYARKEESSIIVNHKNQTDKNINNQKNASHSQRRNGFLAPLECQASNLHYDLRSLIHLFAPRSLFGVPHQHPPDVGGWPGQGRLSLAIQASLELGSSTGNSIPLVVHPKSLAEAVSKSNSSQVMTEMSDAARLAWSTSGHSDPTLPASESHSITGSKTNNKNSSVTMSNFLRQQLVRTHQLADQLFINKFDQVQESIKTGQSKLARISLDIYVKPRQVSIITVPKALSADQLSEFVCESVGSQPPARITWLKNNQPLDPKLWLQREEVASSHQYSSNNNNDTMAIQTTSKLSIRLKPTDHGAQLACRASNEALAQLIQLGKFSDQNQNREQQQQQLPESAGVSQSQPSFISEASMEDSRTLSVNYAPRVKLELGTRVLSSSIRENSDIYFACLVDAQPPAKEIVWLHQEIPINETNSRPNHVVLSNSSLVLQHVHRNQRGSYACIASNSEGVTESNRIELKVLHAPICSPPTSLLADNNLHDDYGEPIVLQPAPTSKISDQGSAAKFHPDDTPHLGIVKLELNKPKRLLCQMIAEPPQVEFSWFLNNSFAQRRLLAQGSTLTTSAPTTMNNSQNNNNPTTSKIENGLDAGYFVTGPNLAQSQLVWSPGSHLDFGQIYCSARNELGESSLAAQQAQSVCQLAIGPAAHGVQALHQPHSDLDNDRLAGSDLYPEPLDCQTLNETSNSVQIICPGSLDWPSPYLFEVDLKWPTSWEIVAWDRKRNRNPYQQHEPILADRDEQRNVSSLRLASGLLQEPIFELQNLPESNTGYQLTISELGPGSVAPNNRRRSQSLKFMTKAEDTADQMDQHDANANPNDNSRQRQSVQPVRIVPLTGPRLFANGGDRFDSAATKLLSNLLITRSASGNQSGRGRNWGTGNRAEEAREAPMLSNNGEKYPQQATGNDANSGSAVNLFSTFYGRLRATLFGQIVGSSSEQQQQQLRSKVLESDGASSGFVSAATGKSLAARRQQSTNQEISSEQSLVQFLFWPMISVMMLTISLGLLFGWYRAKNNGQRRKTELSYSFGAGNNAKNNFAAKTTTPSPQRLSLNHIETQLDNTLHIGSESGSGSSSSNSASTAASTSNSNAKSYASSNALDSAITCEIPLGHQHPHDINFTLARRPSILACDQAPQLPNTNAGLDEHSDQHESLFRPSHGQIFVSSKLQSETVGETRQFAHKHSRGSNIRQTKSRLPRSNSSLGQLMTVFNTNNAKVENNNNHNHKRQNGPSSSANPTDMIGCVSLGDYLVHGPSLISNANLMHCSQEADHHLNGHETLYRKPDANLTDPSKLRNRNNSSSWMYNDDGGRVGLVLHESTSFDQMATCANGQAQTNPHEFASIDRRQNRQGQTCAFASGQMMMMDHNLDKQQSIISLQQNLQLLNEMFPHNDVGSCFSASPMMANKNDNSEAFAKNNSLRPSTLNCKFKSTGNNTKPINDQSGRDDRMSPQVTNNKVNSNLSFDSNIRLDSSSTKRNVRLADKVSNQRQHVTWSSNSSSVGTATTNTTNTISTNPDEPMGMTEPNEIHYIRLVPNNQIVSGLEHQPFEIFDPHSLRSAGASIVPLLDHSANLIPNFLSNSPSSLENAIGLTALCQSRQRAFILPGAGAGTSSSSSPFANTSLTTSPQSDSIINPPGDNNINNKTNSDNRSDNRRVHYMCTDDIQRQEQFQSNVL